MIQQQFSSNNTTNISLHQIKEHLVHLSVKKILLKAFALYMIVFDETVKKISLDKRKQLDAH